MVGKGGGEWNAEEERKKDNGEERVETTGSVK